MLNCRDVVALATDYAEGRLSFTTRAQMWLHLAMCALCRRYIRQMELTRAVLSRLGQTRQTEPGPEVPPAVRDAFRKQHSKAGHSP
ncbi:MAG: zf-HC2 domain-containing protein [Acidobacteriota bacterium]